MSITSGHLTGPERSDLLPVEAVDELIAAADRELSALEREAATATAAADAMQQRVIDEGADKRSSTWAMMQLRRFLDGLNDEVDREVHALVDVAERWSRQRIEEARTEAEAVRARRLPKAQGSEPQEPMGAPLSWFTDSATRLAPPERVMVEAMGPTAAPTTVAATAVTLAHPGTNGNAATPPPETADPTRVEPVLVPDPLVNKAAQLPDTVVVQVPAPAVPVDPAPTDPVAEGARATSAAVVPPAPAVPGDGIVDPLAADPSPAQRAGGSPDPAPAAGASPDDPFWVAPPAPKKRSRRARRIPWTAVLQVLAVIAILVFILLRLG